MEQMNKVDQVDIQPIQWEEGAVILLDQTRLPREEVYLRCDRVEQVAEAICRLAVRGAPLIGIAAAYGLALAAYRRAGACSCPILSVAAGQEQAPALPIRQAAELLRGTRPTARNLFWAIDRMLAKAEAGASAEDLLAEARAIHAEDAEMCRRIGEYGAALLPEGATVMTVCNAGVLATGGIGTALGVIRTAHEAGKIARVLACETRPLLQGARLTMWELTKAGIPARLITDNMAASIMRREKIDAVIAGADRIARNGDTANKIGTYMLAVLAHHHGVPFYVAAPMSTVDLTLRDGSQIPIEERSAEEVTCFGGAPTAPEGVEVMNPAFDVTPAELITVIVTERGVKRGPYEENWGANS